LSTLKQGIGMVEGSSLMAQWAVEQLNIRLVVLEKLQREAEAAQGGLARVSHYVRFKAISKTV
jgi:hypothetical protein